MEVLLPAPELGSPKFHAYVVPPVEVLLKLTLTLPHWFVGDEVKLAVGTGKTFTSIVSYCVIGLVATVTV